MIKKGDLVNYPDSKSLAEIWYVIDENNNRYKFLDTTYLTSCFTREKSFMNENWKIITNIFRE